MGNIRILPTETANRIAAGEVVERPASAVKELVENAIDAGAKKITVKIENGGRKLIQVIDDGHGMDQEDAMLALEAHATSKIQDFFDIDRIQTLGFRGEALPSIAGVSRFRLQTRTKEATAGTEVTVDTGAIRDVRECGCPTGTCVTVRHLFANLPARRKFLRSVATEQGHIQEMILLQALSHPEIGFELFLDQTPALRVTPAKDLSTRMRMLLGKEIGEAMIEVDYQEDNVSIHGFVGRPGITRSSRREQRFFVNGRPASADPLYFAVRDAYHTLVMKGRYPPVVLYLQLPPEEVDVNVHPTKREIRFRDGRRVGRLTAAAVRRALRELTSDMVAPSRFPEDTYKGFSAGPSESGAPSSTAFSSKDHAPSEAKTDSPAASTPPSPEHTGMPVDNSLKSEQTAAGRQESQQTESPETLPFINSGGDPDRITTSASAFSHSRLRDLRVIGIFRKLYLLAEGPDGLVLIDHHAAHERVLYEKILAQAKSEALNSQSLLLPVSLEFSPADASMLNRNLKTFRRLGFQIEPFGGGAFLISGVPPHLPKENIAGMMRDLLDELQTSSSVSNIRLDEQRIAQAACKHAVRAEEKLNQEEIQKLLSDLVQTEMPYTCPHGRPVMINLPHSEIEKRFGRRQS